MWLLGMMACGWTCEVNEAALVSVVALLGWLILVLRSGTLRDMGGKRKLAMAAIWLLTFVAIALLFRSLG